MSFADCIDRAIADKKIAKEKGDRVKAAYQAFFNKHKADGLDDAIADTMAASDVATKLSNKNYERRTAKIAELRKSKELYDLVQSKSPEELPMFVRNFMAERVEVAYEGRRHEFASILHGLLEQFKPRFFGLSQLIPDHRVNFIPFKNKRDMDNIVRAMYGESVNDKSKAFAEMINELTMRVVKHANRFGVSMAWDKNFRLPQHRSRAKLIREGAMQQFIDRHLEWCDWDNMVHVAGEKEGLPILPDERVKFLEESYKILTSDGWHNISPNARRDSIMTRFSYERSIHYKDAQSWIEANDAFGDGTALTQLTTFVDAMARDLALVDSLGPNPSAMKNYLQAAAKKKASDYMFKSGKYNYQNEMESAFKMMNGGYIVFTSQNAASFENMWDVIPSTVRNYITGTFLGSTTLMSVPSDLFRSSARAALVKTSPIKFLSAYIGQLGKANRKQAVRSALIADFGAGMAAGGARFHRDFGGHVWSRIYSDAVLRLSFLTPTTYAAKAANKIELLSVITDMKDKPFSDLDSVFRSEVFDRWGITEKDWDIYRSTQIDPENHFNIIDVPTIRGRSDVDYNTINDIADKFDRLLVNETRVRVIESTLHGQVALGAAIDRGTPAAAIQQSVSNLKSFPVSVMYRLADDYYYTANKRSRGNALANTVAIFTAMTFGGAIGLQLQQIANGRDPLDMTTNSFWGAAALKGGGLGFLGDALFAELNEYGRGVGSMILGPSIDLWNKTRELTVGNLIELAQGKETKFTKELARFVNDYAPLQKTWWYKLPLARIFTEQLHAEVDPSVYEKWSRINSNRLKDYGQEAWWRQGQESPSRSPDINAAFPD